MWSPGWASGGALLHRADELLAVVDQFADEAEDAAEAAGRGWVAALMHGTRTQSEGFIKENLPALTTPEEVAVGVTMTRFTAPAATSVPAIGVLRAIGSLCDPIRAIRVILSSRPSSQATPRRRKSRPLINLHNNLHRALDKAAAAAYGWRADLSDKEVLSRLLALNLARVAGGVAAA